MGRAMRAAPGCLTAERCPEGVTGREAAGQTLNEVPPEGFERIHLAPEARCVAVREAVGG
jgi:hypothetical protein